MPPDYRGELQFDCTTSQVTELPRRENSHLHLHGD